MKIAPPRSRTACLFIGSVLAFAFSNTRTAAEEPASVQPPPMIEIEARFVRATAQQMADAVGKELQGDNQVMLKPEEFAKAVARLKAVKADFFSHSRAVTKSGRKAVIESVRELRYPSEYEPSKEDPTKFIPTAFETRDVGVVLEFGPTVSTQNRDDLKLDFVISVSDFLGFVEGATPAPALKGGKTITTPFEKLKELTRPAIPDGAKWAPLMPRQNVSQSVALRSGQTWLFESYAPSAMLPKGRGSLSFYLFITPRVIAQK